MAYVHCHSCPWSQDDFWSWQGYNPVSFFFKNELGYLRPRFICGDPEFIRHTPLTKALGLTRTARVVWAPKQPGKCDIPSPVYQPNELVDKWTQPRIVTEHMVFSWLVLFRSICKWARRVRTQVWWTWGGWCTAIRKNGNKWPPCPACDDHNLDID